MYMVMYLLGSNNTLQMYIYDTLLWLNLLFLSLHYLFHQLHRSESYLLKWLSACQHAVSPSFSVKVIYVTGTVCFMFVSHFFNSYEKLNSN